MKQESKPEKHAQLGWANKALVILFVLFIWLPTIDTFLHLDSAPIPNENRLPAALPTWQGRFDGVKAYFAGLEAYFCDHFGFRRRLIKWQNKIRNSVFHDQNSRRVLIGSDGWLYITDNQMIEHYRGTAKFSQTELKNWKTLLEFHRDRLAKQGIKFMFVVAPDKHSIYPENVPDWLRPLHGESKLDQFITYMRENSTVSVLDLKPALLAAKKTIPTYKKTDTHWNEFGAFIAYQELIRALSKQLPILEVPAANCFVIKKQTSPTGDLGAFAGITDWEENGASIIAIPELIQKNTHKPHKENSNEIQPKQIFNEPTGINVVVFHDSFGAYWKPFLGYNFNSLSYNKYNHIEADNFTTTTAKYPKANVIILEIVERNFNTILIKKTPTD